MPNDFHQSPKTIDPSENGKDSLSGIVWVYAHQSDVHGGVNVEIDAPAGVKVTVHLNDGLIADVKVPA